MKVKITFEIKATKDLNHRPHNICRLAICGLIMKIFGFAVCGLAYQKHLRICDSGIAQEFSDLRFADFAHFCLFYVQ
jgi:hypothetical protein